MGELELTPRLRQAAQWVPQGVRLADIGTDHGHLPIWLMLQGRIQSAIAADLRPGPLSRARENARRYGVTGIDFRLCDGLSAIRAEECDAVVIAGMGGENIAAILAQAGRVRSAVVKTTGFLKDMNDFAAMNEVYAEFFTEPYPARAAFQAAGIPKGALVEIECVAVKG